MKNKPKTLVQFVPGPWGVSMSTNPTFHSLAFCCAFALCVFGCTTPTKIASHKAEPFISREEAITTALAYVRNTKPNIDISPRPHAEYLATGPKCWRVRVDGIPKKQQDPSKPTYHCGSVSVSVYISPNRTVQEWQTLTSCW